MAFTQAQRAGIRMFLGWPARFLRTGGYPLESAMDAVDGQVSGGDTSVYDLIVTELTRATTIDTALEDARGRFKAAAVGSITLQGPTELALLRSQGRQACGRIADLLGCEILHDAFSPTGPTGRALPRTAAELPYGAGSSDNLVKIG